MTDLLNAYKVLEPSSPRTAVADVLNRIARASPLAFTPSSRASVIQLLLQDIKHAGSKSRISTKDVALALLAVKSLGKDPPRAAWEVQAVSGSEVLATPTHLSLLLSFVSTFKDDQDAANEALRCIANALLLVEDARGTFINKEVHGGDTCLSLLEKSSSPDQTFVLSRILFLVTAAGTPYLQSVVENKHNGRTVVEIISAKVDLLSPLIRNNTPFSREATTDLLKFTFNLLLHYPKIVESDPQTSEIHDDKVIGDFWNSRLDNILPPLLRLYMTLPPTSPCPVIAPLTHVIHALITIPVNGTLRPVWFNQTPQSGSPSRSSNSPSGSRTPQTTDSPTSGNQPEPTSRTPSPTSPKPSAIDRAFSVLAAGRKSLSRSSSPGPPYTGDLIQRTYDLLDTAFEHYFPGDIDVDDASVREKAKAESTDTLDDMLTPLVVLLTRLCIADEAARTRVRLLIIPENLDRSAPLEQRKDILGRCLRMMASVYQPRLKDAIGELLYALSDQDASTLSALVGYGNVAGFLFHKGILSNPPASTATASASLTTPDGEEINPITGTTVQPKNDLPEMSEEEKEREMDKLFVLFDRLERTGAITADQNPIRKAIHEGKIQ